jgi:hypothetical protein
MVTNWAEVEAAFTAELKPLFTGKRGAREAVSAAKQQGETLLAAGQTFTR